MRLLKAEWTITLLVYYEKPSNIEVKVLGKNGTCAVIERRLKTKFGALCLLSFIKNLHDYRGLSAKMRFVGWSTLLLNVSFLRGSKIEFFGCNILKVSIN